MRREDLFVHEMIDAATAIIALVGDATEDNLEDDSIKHSAILWNFTVLGEAANQLSDSTREAFPAIEWRAATALRNRVVHAYGNIDPRIIVDAAKNDLPPMIEHLRSVLATLEDPPPPAT